MPAIATSLRKKNISSKGLPDGIRIRKINASFLHPGMFIDSEIYLKSDDIYVLFCKNTLLHKDILKKMKKRLQQTDYNVYVNEKSYYYILQQSRDFEKLAELSDLTYAETQSPRHINHKNLRIAENQSINDIRNTLSVLSSDNPALINEIFENSKSLSGSISSDNVLAMFHCIRYIIEQNKTLYLHSYNVAMLNGLIGKWLNLPVSDIERLIYIGLLHDIGKIRNHLNLQCSIMSKSNDEVDRFFIYSEYSYQILLESGVTDSRILSGIRFNSKNQDGSNLQDGLLSDKLPLFANITALSDSFDSFIMNCTNTAYSPTLLALQSFYADENSILDEHVLSAFLQNIPKYYIGKQAVLSDGCTTTIEYINPHDYLYPIVKNGEQNTKTNKFLRCVSVDSLSFEDLLKVQF